jgi:chromosome segregation ATPase
MGMMSANIPYPVSSLVDVLSIMELAHDPAKVKKAVKELQAASIHFQEKKEALDISLEKIDKKQSAIDLSSVKLEVSKKQTEEAINKLCIESAKFEARESAIKAIEKDLEEKSKKLDADKKASERSFQEAMRNTSEKNDSLIAAQAECDKLIAEYKEKLSKLKAVIE